MVARILLAEHSILLHRRGKRRRTRARARKRQRRARSARGGVNITWRNALIGGERSLSSRILFRLSAAAGGLRAARRWQQLGVRARCRAAVRTHIFGGRRFVATWRVCAVFTRRQTASRGNSDLARMARRQAATQQTIAARARENVARRPGRRAALAEDVARYRRAWRSVQTHGGYHRASYSSGVISS